jgi:hypothetical protein
LLGFRLSAQQISRQAGLPPSNSCPATTWTRSTSTWSRPVEGWATVRTNSLNRCDQHRHGRLCSYESLPRVSLLRTRPLRGWRGGTHDLAEHRLGFTVAEQNVALAGSSSGSASRQVLVLRLLSQGPVTRRDQPRRCSATMGWSCCSRARCFSKWWTQRRRGQDDRIMSRLCCLSSAMASRAWLAEIQIGLPLGDASRSMTRAGQNNARSGGTIRA